MFTFPFTLFGGAFSNVFSVLFDGVDERVDCGGDSSINFDNTDTFSFSFWAKHTSLSGFQVLMSNIDGTLTFRGIEVMKSSGNKIRFNIISTASADSITIESTNTVSASVWYNVVATYDGNDAASGAKIYIDGVLETPIVVNDDLTSTTISNGNMSLGARPQPALFLNGNLDEPSIWSVELSQAEVTEIYNSGKPSNLDNHSQVTSLKAWWHMGDNDTFPTLEDNAGGVNTGTMTNMEAGDIVEDVP